MSKRASQFKRNERDFYPTPPEAVAPLLHFLAPGTDFCEPCAGDGRLIRELERHGHFCSWAFDIQPRGLTIGRRDAMHIDAIAPAQTIITNPPWPRPGGAGEPVISLAMHLSDLAPTWLLLPWDFAANKYFSKLAPRCEMVVPIGRVSWEGNGAPGKDNAAWYLFTEYHTGKTELVSRGEWEGRT